MATQTLPLFQENYLALTGMVRRWDRRLRLRQTLLWLPRSLLPGLVIGLLLAVLSRMRPWLLPKQIALVTGGAGGGSAWCCSRWRSGCGGARR